MMKQKSALFFLFSTLFIGCGPIGAHSSIAKAHIAVEAAQAVEADRYAVYEYSKATFYLRKAKEEEGFSSFQEAIDFARNAKSFADAARARAIGNKRVKPRTLQEQRSVTQPAALPALGGASAAPMPSLSAPSPVTPAPMAPAPMAPAPAPLPSPQP